MITIIFCDRQSGKKSVSVTLHWASMANHSNGHLGLDLNSHLGQSQMAIGGLFRPGLKSPPWCTH